MTVQSYMGAVSNFGQKKDRKGKRERERERKERRLYFVIVKFL